MDGQRCRALGYHTFLKLRSQNNRIISPMIEGSSALSKLKPSLHNCIPYYFLTVLILMGFFVGYYFNMPYLVIFFIFGVIPYLDKYTTQDWENPSLKQVKEMEQQVLFKVVLYVTVFMEWLAYYLMMVFIPRMSFIKAVGLMFLAINLFGVGFMLSHELIHKGFADKVIGTMDQIKSLYGHFTIEHVYGHHRRVATPDDPASAPKGMTVYQFLPRSIVGSYKSSYHLDPFLTTLLTISYFVFLLIIHLYFGSRGLLLALLMAGGAITMLEVINYVEHYGLQRVRSQSGEYEKVTIRHSWNAPHRMSNYLLFKLQRHSDHHENAKKPYQTLCSYEDSPLLPHGYVVCMMMAMVPSVWFSVIDPLVDEYASNKTVLGSKLQHYKESVEKTQRFVSGMLKLTGGMAAVEVLEVVIRKFVDSS